MRDNLKGELDPAVMTAGAARILCLTCIDKRTKEGCDRGSEVETAIK